MTDPRIEKWTRWCEGPIQNSILTMHLQRDTWQQVGRILTEHGRLPDSYWWEFMVDTYAVTQAVAVRRQADTHPGVASLGKLISEISEDSDRITREFWLDLWADDPFDILIAQREWAATYGGTAVSHLDPAIATADLSMLRSASAVVKNYVDKHVAHADYRAARSGVTLSLTEVHDVIDVIGTLYQKYYSLLTAHSMGTLVPIIQHDWTAVFRQPWIKPKDVGRHPRD